MVDPTLNGIPLTEKQMNLVELGFLAGIKVDAWLPILGGAMQRHQLAPYQLLYRQDEPVKAIYILVHGQISQYREEAVAGKRVRTIARTIGDTKLLRDAKLLGHLEFLFGSPYATNAKTEDVCELLSISVHAFSRLIYHFPQIRDALYPKQIADRLGTFPFASALGAPPQLHPVISAFLADETKVEEKGAGTPVYKQGDLMDDVFLIHEGQVKIEERGRPFETHLLGNGAIFGAASTVAGFIGLGSIDRPMLHTATVQTETKLYKIPYNSFKSITGLDPEMQMDRDIKRCEEAIRQVPIFAKVGPALQQTIAGFCSHYYFPNTYLIVQQGEIADSLWVLLGGSASIRANDKHGQQLTGAMAIAETYFAEQALLGQISQESTVEANPGSEWLRLHWTDLEAINKLHGIELRTDLIIRSSNDIKPMAESDQRKRDEWLEPGEQIVIRTRRHWIAFLLKMLPAAIVFAIFLAGFWFTDMLPGTQYILRSILVLLLLTDLVTIIWGTIDYFNDWLAVTDQRVVHQEKVLFVNEWRKQAPLEQIQNVDFRTTWLGKILDYGTLTIATAATAGTITFDFSTGFSRLRDEIMKRREQRRRHTTAASKLTIHRMLEERLGIAVNIPSRVYHGGPALEEKATLRKRLSRSVEARLRREQGDRVIWRKHWLVLLPRLWFPLLVFLIVTILAILPPITELLGAPRETIPFLNALTLVGVVFTLFALAQVIWVIADWRNDTYEVSNEEIVHVDRMPLGLSEDRKSANLGRIQNVSMSIPSTLHWLFNYGNVTCQTAAELGAFVFYGVPDPRRVEQEILTRMERHRKRSETDAATKRSQDLPDWFEMYNRIEPEILDERSQRNGQP